LKNVNAIKYAYIINSDGVIISNFNPEKTFQVLDDEHMKEISEYSNRGEPLIVTINDKDGGLIFDLSKPMFHPAMRTKIGTVRIGFSDKILRDEIAKVTINILLIALFSSCLAIAGAIFISIFTVRNMKW